MSTRRGTPAHRAGRTEQRRLPIGAMVVGGIVLAFLAVFVIVVVLDVRQQAGSMAPSGVRSYSNLSRNHTEAPMNYPQNPPVGGDHNLVWQNCGFYSKPVRNESAVHSLEHGAVWITYSPDLPKEQVDRIRELASDNTYVLASPYPDLPAPMVASAWGKQLQVQSADDTDLEQFVSAYRQGPQTPEPGAVCTGGTGTPQSS